MGRSKWKGPYIDKSLIFVNENNSISNKKISVIFSRNSVILPIHVGFLFNIHNGKKFLKLKVSEEMVGHKFGEFSVTRVPFSFKKKKK